MSVPNDYEVSFEKAERTFLYQIVFDPNSSTLVPLNPLPDEIQSDQLHFAGQYPFLLQLQYVSHVIIVSSPHCSLSSYKQ